MKYGSVCSGIEAATAAWHPLGWEPEFFSEIEAFPSAVLAHHYPEVPNLGDMTKFKEWPDANINVLGGGTPCQSFSVAGLRKGLDDPRGNLMLTFGAIAAKYRPKWLVWENVPGVLSANGGRDFGTFLGMLGQLGYGFAYRVLDAQYTGLAQRRKRVFVVGCLGDWRGAAAVLFERHSLSGDIAPSRETGQVAPTIPSRSTAGGGLGTDFDCSGGLISMECMVLASGQANAELTRNISPALNCNRDGAPIAFPINTQIATRHNKLGEGTGLGIDTDGDPAYTLQAAHHHAVAFGWQNSASQGDSASEHVSPTLDKSKTPAVGFGMCVRRLTPRECERLQGFPDDFTSIPYRKKPADNCPDGPRYKALGNSMAVPVMRWIGERIQLVDGICREAGVEAQA